MSCTRCPTGRRRARDRSSAGARRDPGPALAGFLVPGRAGAPTGRVPDRHDDLCVLRHLVGLGFHQSLLACRRPVLQGTGHPDALPEAWPAPDQPHLRGAGGLTGPGRGRVLHPAGPLGGGAALPVVVGYLLFLRRRPPRSNHRGRGPVRAGRRPLRPRLLGGFMAGPAASGPAGRGATGDRRARRAGRLGTAGDDGPGRRRLRARGVLQAPGHRPWLGAWWRARGGYDQEWHARGHAAGSASLARSRHGRSHPPARGDGLVAVLPRPDPRRLRGGRGAVPHRHAARPQHQLPRARCRLPGLLRPGGRRRPHRRLATAAVKDRGDTPGYPTAMTGSWSPQPVMPACPATTGLGPTRLRIRPPATSRHLRGTASTLPVRAWPVTVLGLLALLISSIMQPRIDEAWATDEPVFTPVAWKSYPNNDSVEMGDHSLNLNFSYGGPNDVVSSAAHNTHFGSRGRPSGFSVLLRTSSDGATRKLPPTDAISSRLSSVRVGLTPTSTLAEGANAGLRLSYQVTKPYLPSDTVDELNSQITNGPFMYVRLQVRNTTTSSRPASAVYVGFNASCGPPLDEWPRPGWRALRMCNAGDTGGTRYLAAPKTAGSSWGTGPDTVSDFQGDGILSGADGTGRAAIALPVPALAAGAQHSTTLVYGAWHDDAGITAVDGTRYRFYYRGWWAGPAAMLRFAIDNMGAAFAGSASFDERVRQVSPDTGAQYG